MNRRIRVMLVDDDSFWRENITSDLSEDEDMEVVAAATTKEEAIEAASNVPMDVILMDLNLTGNNLDGLEAAAHILKSVSHDLKIIMLTSVTESQVVLESFRLGALNYINKSSYKDIRHAITEAYFGRSSIHFDAARIMRNEAQLADLTPMEREVFELRKKGLNKREISEMLHKSMNTIKTQLRSIKNKLIHFKMD